MKYLILTCSTGGGHHSTAAAISDILTANGHHCVTLDCLDFLSPAKAKLISEGHILLYRKAPKLFGLGYRFEEAHTPKLILSQCEACADEFYEAVTACGCDAVINVHVFSALIMSAAKRLCGLDLPGYFVATDYTCSPGVGLTEQDAYFIPHPALTDEFIRCGVPADRIIPTGIPVRREYHTTVPRLEARAALGLPQSGNLVLLTCGSMGAGPMEELAIHLDRTMAPGDRLAVVCGTNEKLKHTLDRAGLSDRIHVRGFEARMDLYMDAADLILTKAGGLASTEALMKRLPIVFINAVPGCETRNLEFLTARRCAATANTPEDLAILVCTLLQDPEGLTRWRAHLAEEFPLPPAEQLCAALQALEPRT